MGALIIYNIIYRVYQKKKGKQNDEHWKEQLVETQKWLIRLLNLKFQHIKKYFDIDIELNQGEMRASELGNIAYSFYALLCNLESTINNPGKTEENMTRAEEILSSCNMLFALYKDKIGQGFKLSIDRQYARNYFDY